MNRKFLSQVFLFALAVLAGCGQNSNKPQSKVTATKVYSEAELDKLIVPGMSIAEVTNKFGPPASEMQIKENVVNLMYTFRFETITREERLHMTGFDVHTKDGKVVVWSPIMGEARKMFHAGGSQNSFGEQLFQVFLAIDSLTNVANTVDSEASADASSLKVSP